MSPRTKFKKGDTVILKTKEGPKMVVESIIEPLQSYLDINYICVWASKDSVYKIELSEHVIEIAP